MTIRYSIMDFMSPIPQSGRLRDLRLEAALTEADIQETRAWLVSYIQHREALMGDADEWATEKMEASIATARQYIAILEERLSTL